MLAHLRGILTLFVLTLLLCSIVYPLALWAVGKTAFPKQAEGSLIVEDGKVRGSNLIGQPFAGAGYFQPRPSAAGNGYNAALSGGSNYSVNNAKLRDRVARTLGTTARFKSGEPVGPAIDKWLSAKTDLKNVKSDEDPHAAFFEMWYQEVKPDLDRVPADMVLASGSGLDPHITLRSANYQAPGVIAERAKAFPEAAKPQVKTLVEELIHKHAATTMGGIAGGDALVNVLEINLALDAAMKDFKPR